MIRTELACEDRRISVLWLGKEVYSVLMGYEPDWVLGSFVQIASMDVEEASWQRYGGLDLFGSNDRESL